jgi:hypothetical protein
MHSDLARANIDEIRRRAERMARRGAVGGWVPRKRSRAVASAPELAVTLRYATPDDDVALARLAALDERPLPTGPILLAEVEGELRAALAVRDGATLANPFFATAGLLQLLIARAAQLRGEAPVSKRRGPLLKRASLRSAAPR